MIRQGRIGTCQVFHSLCSRPHLNLLGVRKLDDALFLVSKICKIWLSRIWGYIVCFVPPPCRGIAHMIHFKTMIFPQFSLKPIRSIQDGKRTSGGNRSGGSNARRCRSELPLIHQVGPRYICRARNIARHVCRWIFFCPSLCVGQCHEFLEKGAIQKENCHRKTHQDAQGNSFNRRHRGRTTYETEKMFKVILPLTFPGLLLPSWAPPRVDVGCFVVVWMWRKRLWLLSVVTHVASTAWILDEQCRAKKNQKVTRKMMIHLVTKFDR